jgi:hypothetical protein
MPLGLSAGIITKRIDAVVLTQQDEFVRPALERGFFGW